MATPDIVTWCGGKWGFYVDRHYDTEHSRWRHVKGPIRLADYHAAILRHCFTPGDDGRLPYDTVALCEPAKSGKSAVAALVHEWFALHVEPPAEQYVISNKRDQAASKVFKSLCQSVEWNPHLRIVPNKYELTFRSGTVVKAIPCNARTESGARFTLASFDEPWGIVYEDGERLTAEFKTDPTRTVSCRLFTGYGGYAGESDLWQDLLESGLEGEPAPGLEDIGDGRGVPACWRNGRTFVFWSHVTRQPWQTVGWLASLETMLIRGEFARQVHCDFASSVETFVQPEWWDACRDPGLPALRPGDGTPLVLSVDASVSGDCTALAVTSRHPQKPDVVAVRYVKVWEPPRGGALDYDVTLLPDLVHWCTNYNVVQLNYDPYQLHYFMTQFRKRGLTWVVEFDQGAARLKADSDLRQRIIARTLAHDGDPILRQHVLNAAAKVTGEDSKLRIVKKGRAPMDALVAVSQSVSECSRLNLGESAVSKPRPPEHIIA